MTIYSKEHRDWLRDREAEHEIRALKAYIARALDSEAFCFRAHPDVVAKLREVNDQLAKDADHIVAVWD